MKKILIASALLAAILFTTNTYAQFIAKGSILGGGSVAISNTSYAYDNELLNDGSNFQFSLSPSAQFFVADNLGIGASLDVSLWTSSYDGNQNASGTSLTFGPIARYYFSDGPFIEGFFRFGTSKSRYEGPFGETESKANTVQTGAGFGWSIKITDSILFDPMAGYQFSSSEGDTSGTLYLKAGFSLLLKQP